MTDQNDCYVVTSRNARSKDRYLGATASPPSKPTKQKKIKNNIELAAFGSSLPPPQAGPPTLR